MSRRTTLAYTDSDDDPKWSTPESNLIGANFKCIALSLFLAGAYWWLPRRNKYVLVAILYFTYLALAWYDHLYRCQRNLKPTYLAYFYQYLKPYDGKQREEWRLWPNSLRKKIFVVDMIILAILVALLPWFLAWNPK